MPTKAGGPKAAARLPQLPARPADAHKGMFGRVLVVGGSLAMPGSVALVANAAYRSGAGLVRIFCPASAQPIAIGLAMCCTSAPADQTSGGQFALTACRQLLEQASEHDVLAMGPGMGQSPACAQLVETALVRAGKPVVLDADGLNNLAWLGGVPRLAGPLVITPHPGEATRLLRAFGLNVKLSGESRSRQAAARALAEYLDCVVVLKGKGTVVTDGKRLYVNSTGNPGMAAGGTGDVLTGVIAALIGQNLVPYDAAVLGTYLHGLAGDIAADRLGQHSLTAGDLLDTLPEAFLRHASK